MMNSRRFWLRPNNQARSRHLAGTQAEKFTRTSPPERIKPELAEVPAFVFE
jgi:hypothetical protein